ncbi:hypothetical protein ENSA7_63560 [Enhygromyxa salina]|uniref:MetS family NSS transporter small subunit n=1 Tax=Enhygromyxa salina TaxID=215803 RepID=A0A2S9Y2I5_9BACT|nr:hypothetical protein ENSA7_63560 [Enhygromyxa salina]
MTTTGIVFMITSLTCVWGLALWCYRKVLASPKPPEPPDD